jgi:hypothetical protein
MLTFKSNRRLSPQRKASIFRGLKRSWAKGGAHHERFLNRHADADTMRKRALWDRKGAKITEIILAGHLHTIAHAQRRTDSYDVFLGDKIVCSGGRAKVFLFLSSLLP